MSEELISRYIDEAAIKKQTDFLLSQLSEIDKAYNLVKTSLGALTFSTNSKEVIAGLKEQAAASKVATQAVIDLEKAQQSKLKTEQEAIKISKEQERVELEKAKTATQAAKIQTEASKQSASARLAEAKSATEAAKARDIEAKTQFAYNRENDRTIKTIEKEEKALSTLSSDYKILSLAQKDAIARYQNLVLLVGANDPVAKAAGKEAEALTAQLKKVDEATGVYTRNVGNYSSAFGKAFGAIKTAANIIPGLGISGIFLLAFEAIKKVLDAFDVFSTKLTETKASHEAYNSVVAASAGELGKAQTEVIGLQEKISLAKQGFIDKSLVLKEYNETIGKSIGHANSLGEAEKRLIDKAPAFIKFTYLKAQAQTAADLASKEAAKGIEAQSKTLDDFVDTSDAAVSVVKTFLSQINPFATEGEKALKAGISLANTAKKEQGKQITEAELRYNKLTDLQKKYIDEAAKYAKDNKINFYDEKDTKNSTQNFKDDIVKAQNSANKLLLQAQLDLYKSVFDNERNSYTVRLDALNSFNAVQRQMLKVERDNDLAANKEKRDSDLSGEGLSLKQKADIIKAANIERKNIEGKYLNDVQKLTLDQDKQLEDLRLKNLVSNNQKRIEFGRSYREDEAKFYDEILQRQLVEQETASTNEQAVLTRKFNRGKITKDQYEKGLLDIQLKYARLAAEAQIKYLESEVALFDAGTKGKEEAENKLAKARLALSKNVVDTEKNNQQEIINTIGDIQKYTTQAFDVVGAAINNSITSQKNALQEVEDQRQKNYEDEVARINASSLTEDEKTKKIMLLEAQRKAQKDKFERDQRQLDLQRARFEKAQAITNVILNTAVSIAKVLGNPFLVALAATIGAAQLAIAISAPLPKFKHGKFNNYEGMAIVGDGGKSEPIVRADGTIEMSPATPTQTWIGKNDLVFPDIEALRNRVATAQTDRVLGSNYRSNGSDGLNNDALKKALERHGKDVVSAIQNKPTVHFNVTERGMQVIAQSGNSWTEYINSNVRGTA